MSEPKKYILFCAQEANFQTRSVLIPYDLIMKCEQRVKDLEILRSNSLRNIPFNNGQYIVDQLLIRNITWDGNVGRYDDNPFIDIVDEIMSYIDRQIDEVRYLYDEEWAREKICHIASKGFNHVANYCNFRKRTSYKGEPIEIVEGFLILESERGRIEDSADRELKLPAGRIRTQDVDTVEEMYEKYYSESI